MTHGIGAAVVSVHACEDPVAPAGSGVTGTITLPRLRVPDIEKVMHEEIRRLTLAEPVVVPLASEVSVGQLMQLDAKEFVVAAYRAILGRDPDSAGLQHHLASARTGRRKVALIESLRSSPEGRRRAVALKDVPVVESRWSPLYRLPIVGRPIRLMAGLLTVGVLRRDVQGLHDAIVELQRAVERQGRRGDALERRTSESLASLSEHRGRSEDAERRVRQLGSTVDGISASARVLSGKVAELTAMQAARDTPEQIARAMGMLAEVFSPLLEEASTDSPAAVILRAAEALRAQETRIRNAERLAEHARNEILDERRRIGLLLETVRRQSAGLGEEQRAALARAQAHRLDSLYVDFEARFRGPRDMIKSRQRAHLPLIEAASAGTESRPIVDVGAGRGEWLELISEHGLTGRGIDLNSTMVEYCRARGLDCIEGDVLEEMAKLGSGTVGAVTGFHIIEHLSFHVMVALFDEAFRVLLPGGVIVFETPNPNNLQVGSRTFYMDPTHRNPLPGEMVAMVAEARGFTRIRIQPLHPMEESFDALDQRLGEQLDALLHGPQDYALIGYKA